MLTYKQVCQKILKEARKRKVQTLKELNKIKMDVLSDHPEVQDIPNNADLIVSGTQRDREVLGHVLHMKPMRTISGVSPIALMTDPYPCPHSMKNIGPCTYCPGGPGSPWGDVPQSYTGEEPSTRRSARNHYDPYIGVFNRLEHYLAMNHVPEKVEIILQGGTFPFCPKNYQIYFSKYIYKAMNDFSLLFYEKGKLNYDRFTQFFELPATLDEQVRSKKIHAKCLYIKNLDLNKKTILNKAMKALFDSKKELVLDENYGIIEISGSDTANVKAMKRAIQKVRLYDDPTFTLEALQQQNETAQIRCVGFTIETKSDYGKLQQGNDMLELGCTRVELGIQTIYDDILEKTHRGNTVQDNIDSIRILKDLGFKINAHVMPGLPGSNLAKDRKMLKNLFDDTDYRPDMLKVYPCMVLKGTKLYEDFEKGLFKPLTTPKAAKLIAWFMGTVPEYCRVMRVQRDIPTFMTEGGVDKTNLRQYIEKEMDQQGIVARDMRAREPGFSKGKGKKEQMSIEVQEYQASQGTEFFITYEDTANDVMYGYARLRFPSEFLRKEITSTSALLRELHVFGQAVSLGQKGDIQHTGIGKKLLKKAEEICKQRSKDKVVVISGVGVREYYKKLGYEKEGPYMVKNV